MMARTWAQRNNGGRVQERDSCIWLLDGRDKRMTDKVDGSLRRRRQGMRLVKNGIEMRTVLAAIRGKTVRYMQSVVSASLTHIEEAGVAPSEAIREKTLRLVEGDHVYVIPHVRKDANPHDGTASFFEVARQKPIGD